MRIEPRKSFDYEGEVPGDKSVTHRAVMLGAVASGETVIRRPLASLDTLATADCMRRLGAEIRTEDGRMIVRGMRRPASGLTLDCGNSGTSMRLLTGLLAGQNVSAVLTGDASLCRRPMNRVIRPLEKLGAKIVSKDGYAPLSVLKAELTGTEVFVDVPSAQVKSAAILAGLGASGETTVRFGTVTRDHTERMLGRFGARVETGEGFVKVMPGKLAGTEIDVCGDISSAAYVLAAGALLGRARVNNVGVNPTRAGILRVFEALGAPVKLENPREVSGEPAADLLIEESALRPVEISGDLVANVIDELPVIAVLCCFARGRSVIRGAGELRVKESDRIVLLTKTLTALGARVEELPDGLAIAGGNGLFGTRDGAVDPAGDHRIAMSAAVAALASERGAEISDFGCADVSFPNFWRVMNGHE